MPVGLKYLKFNYMEKQMKTLFTLAVLALTTSTFAKTIQLSPGEKHVYRSEGKINTVVCSTGSADDRQSAALKLGDTALIFAARKKELGKCIVQFVDGGWCHQYVKVQGLGYPTGTGCTMDDTETAKFLRDAIKADLCEI